MLYLLYVIEHFIDFMHSSIFGVFYLRVHPVIGLGLISIMIYGYGGRFDLN